MPIWQNLRIGKGAYLSSCVLTIYDDCSELLDKVKRWEDVELTDLSEHQKPVLSVTAQKLAPLNEGGPTQLLQVQISQLESENEKLQLRLKTLEAQATSALQEKAKLGAQVEELKSEVPKGPTANIDHKELEEVCNFIPSFFLRGD